jgi:hypothetical protein
MILEQRTKGYLYLVVGALLIGIVLPTIVRLIILALGIVLIGYGALMAMSATKHLPR